MSSQEMISLALKAGCEVTEYDDHYCVKRTLDVSVVVTFPKVAVLVRELVAKIKDTLGL